MSNVNIKQDVASSSFSNTNQSIMLPALTGVRFFAIFHIFWFHLQEIRDVEKPPQFGNMLADMSTLPEKLLVFISNGWMSTSFFFILSGFILAFLYWGNDGQLSVTRKQFWHRRAARIYPLHMILVLVTAFLMIPNAIGQGNDLFNVFTGTVATLFLLQAWNPEWVPLISWPTWTLSALVFLYFLIPFLMSLLAKLTRFQSILLLAALPFISLLPTLVYAYYFPAGSEPQQFWQIFIGSTPIFWVAHLMAGMLLSRVFTISRFNPNFTPDNRWLSIGDLAFLIVIALTLIPDIQEPLKFYLRHGLMMPLYLVIIYDLAKGNGLAAKFFSLPGMKFIGETGFSIFIWQNIVMIGLWISLLISPLAGQYQFFVASVFMIILGIFSTYILEKPLSRWVRRKWLNGGQRDS